jgi:FkbM family methyltransferase
MTVFDVGANIGLFSLEALRRCGGDGRLFAFEPAPEPFAALERNVQEQFPDIPAHLDRRALSDRSGTATLHYRPRASGTSSLYDHDEGDSKGFIDAMLQEPPAEYRDVVPRWFQRLPRPLARRLLRLAARWVGAEVIELRCTTTTLSEVLREFAVERVDLLKIDVEGAELDVLRGIVHEDWPKIASIAAEVHDVNGRLGTIRRMLEDAGFRVEAQQEWPFVGTHLHLVRATRPAERDNPQC